MRGEKENDACRRLFEDLEQRVHCRVLHAFDGTDQAATVRARAHVVETLLDSTDVVDTDRVCLRFRFDAMALWDVGALRDDLRILTHILNPELIDHEQIRMEQACELLVIDVQELTREPLGDREFAQMTGTGKQIRMRDVALREILREGFEMGVMAEDVRCESYGMTIVADKLSRKGYLTLA